MHNTHVFLLNQFNDNESAKIYVQNALDEGHWDNINYYNIEGVIDFETKEFEQDEYVKSSRTGIVSTKDLIEFANNLVGKDKYEELKQNLNRLIKSELWFTARSVCEVLDGMQAARAGQWEAWTLENPFPINDGYLYMDGIDDWQSVQPDGKLKAVIVDFHS